MATVRTDLADPATTKVPEAAQVPTTAEMKIDPRVTGMASLEQQAIALGVSLDELLASLTADAKAKVDAAKTERSKIVAGAFDFLAANLPEDSEERKALANEVGLLSAAGNMALLRKCSVQSAQSASALDRRADEISKTLGEKLELSEKRAKELEDIVAAERARVLAAQAELDKLKTAQAGYASAPTAAAETARALLATRVASAPPSAAVTPTTQKRDLMGDLIRGAVMGPAVTLEGGDAKRMKSGA